MGVVRWVRSGPSSVVSDADGDQPLSVPWQHQSGVHEKSRTGKKKRTKPPPKKSDPPANRASWGADNPFSSAVPLPNRRFATNTSAAHSVNCHTKLQIGGKATRSPVVFAAHPTRLSWIKRNVHWTFPILGFHSVCYPVEKAVANTLHVSRVNTRCMGVWLKNTECCAQQTTLSRRN